MIASKISGLAAFLAASLAIAVGASPIIRRTPKLTRDPPQSMTVPSTGGRARLMRRSRNFVGVVDSVGRMAEESVGGVQQGTNALLQISAHGDVINTGSKEPLNAESSASVVKMSSINGIASSAGNHKNANRFDNINGAVPVTSMEDATSGHDHATVSAPSLCHEEIVSEMCMALNNQTKEYYNTETDADTGIVHAAEIAEQLSASQASVLSFLNEIGATNLETDKLLLEHGAFAVKCMDLCLKTVDSIPENLRPPTSDVACIPSVDPVAAPDCSIDVSPKAVDAIMEAKVYPGETDGDVEGGLKEADKDHAYEVTENEKNGMNEILEKQNEDKSFEQLQVDVALLFRIHPVANVSVDMDDKNMSDEPHFLDAGNASRIHVLNDSFLAGLENAPMSRKASLTAVTHDIWHLNNLARAALSSTINKMAGGRTNDLVRKFFKSSDPWTVSDVRRSMDSAIRVLSNVYYKKGWVTCFRKGVVAYVVPYRPAAQLYGWWGPYVVNLCDIWINHPRQSYRVHVLVHEAMHHGSAYEKDERYDCWPCLRLPRQQALNNADSMAYFAMEVHGHKAC